jgi:hypothetical protein
VLSTFAPPVLESVFYWDAGFKFTLSLAYRLAVPIEIFFGEPLTSTSQEIYNFYHKHPPSTAPKGVGGGFP